MIKSASFAINIICVENTKYLHIYLIRLEYNIKVHGIDSNIVANYIKLVAKMVAIIYISIINSFLKNGSVTNLIVI